MRAAQLKVAEAGSMKEGSAPVSILVPSLHRVQHYPEQTKTLGRLRQYALFCFEGYNKWFKNFMARNNAHAVTTAGIFCTGPPHAPATVSTPRPSRPP